MRLWPGHVLPSTPWPRSRSAISVTAHYMFARALLVARDAETAAMELEAAAQAAEAAFDPVTHAVALLDLADLVIGPLRGVISDAEEAANRMRAHDRVDPNATLLTA